MRARAMVYFPEVGRGALIECGAQIRSGRLKPWGWVDGVANAERTSSEVNAYTRCLVKGA